MCINAYGDSRMMIWDALAISVYREHPRPAQVKPHARQAGTAIAGGWLVRSGAHGCGGKRVIRLYGYIGLLQSVVRSCGQQVVFSLNENGTV